MANVPKYLWPEPACYLQGSVLHVGRARWFQDSSFLPLVEPAKWMVAVFVDGTLVHGQQIGSPAAGNSTTITGSVTGEVPFSQKTITVDLASYGVHDSHPLDPTVKVEHYAGTSRGGGEWQWCGQSMETALHTLVQFIDSRAGVHHGFTLGVDPWCPLTRCFYDEWAEEGVDWTHYYASNWHPPDPTPDLVGSQFGSMGMVFHARWAYVTFYGAQFYIHPDMWDLDPPAPMTEEVTVRLWEDGIYAPPETIVRQKTVVPEPGWTNFLWDEPYEAKTTNIPDPDDPTGFPYEFKANPDHDGSYTIGYETYDGAYRHAGNDVAYSPVYPEHKKGGVDDAWPGGVFMKNRAGPEGTTKEPDQGPFYNEGAYNMIGPIYTYKPIYPVPSPFVPQIYRRVVTEVH